MNIADSFDAAFREHQAGNLTAALELYQHVLEREPRHADALHLMGVLAFQTGRHDVAETLISRAIDVKPAADYCGNLGLVLAAAGRPAEAVAAYRRALALRVDFPEAHNNLGNALRQSGDAAGAAAAYSKAITLRPGFSEAFNNLGLVLGELGEDDNAIEAFTAAIALQPNAADARNNLGNVLHRKGELARAIACWREALSLRPDYPEALNNLGNGLKECGRDDEAANAFQQAVALQPNFPEAWNNLGVMQCGRGEVAAAIISCRRAVEQRPAYAEAYYNLAIAFRAAGERAAAVAACRQAVRLRPRWAEACNNVGIWLFESAQLQEALSFFDQAVSIRSDYAEAFNNRGNVLAEMGRANEAIASFHRAAALHPDFAEAQNNLGNVLKHCGRTQEAIAAFRRALALRPDLPEASNNLGNALKDQGELDEAIACYERALARRPGDAAADSNRCYTLHFHPGYNGAAIAAEHRRWNARHAAALESRIVARDNDPAPGRRLRIGYVSPDFREHCQAMFTVPLLSRHDHARFEIFCYSDVTAPDAVTQRLRGYADVWRPIAGMSDVAAADLIRHDKIDVLIDLTVHMSYNRLLVFARKPAPVQVTWLGYPGTTGLTTMDYRLSDPYLDPPGHDGFYTEETIRLPDSFWCYDPLAERPAVDPLPAAQAGYVTFGCLNNFCKINTATLRLWARVLRATPQSRLLLLAPAGDARLRVLEKLRQENISPTRIDFSDRLTRRNYLELYHRIDVGLDSFPYNGHTTSLDSFWMGVPVVTRIGATAVGRGGFSQLSNLGLTELATESEEQFVQAAAALAADVERMKHLRATLRQRLLQSPLCDAARFAANMELAYRQMWQRWSAAAEQGGVKSAAESVTLQLFAKEKRQREMEMRRAS
jgi:predicted O-linked N-acetylglucosamine transferase (SPINDLY family)